ncbi:MAG: hypothetical protein ACM3OO_04675 [Planctomycetaceae bacterium]
MVTTGTVIEATQGPDHRRVGMLPADVADRVRRSRRRTMRLIAGTVLSALAVSGLGAAGSGADTPSPAWNVAAVAIVLSLIGNGAGAIVSALRTRGLRRRAMMGSTPPVPGSPAAAHRAEPPLPPWPADGSARGHRGPG